MPERLVEDWIQSYLDYTDNSEPPYLFREWCAVSVIASALQRKCWLEWGPNIVYPNLYIVLTAPAGKARKGTSMSAARKFISRIGIPIAAEAVTREALIRTIKESEDVVQSDKGIYIHSSITVFSPELTVFLGYNNVQLMSDLTDWFDCADSWQYRTKNSGTDEIKGIFVNLLGATTPELLRSTLPNDAVGGGLTSRMIFVFEEKKGKIVPYPFLSAQEKKLEEMLLLDIERIHFLQGPFKISKSFFNRWGEWYVSQEGKNPFKTAYSHNFDGYIERRAIQVLKLSMVMSAARSDDMLLDLSDIDKAINILERTEVKMPKAFGGFGQSSTANLVFEIFNFISERGSATTTDIIQRFLYDGTMEEINASLDVLVRGKYLKLGIVNDITSYIPVK